METICLASQQNNLTSCHSHGIWQPNFRYLWKRKPRHLHSLRQKWVKFQKSFQRERKIHLLIMEPFLPRPTPAFHKSLHWLPVLTVPCQVCVVLTDARLWKSRCRVIPGWFPPVLGCHHHLPAHLWLWAQAHPSHAGYQHTPLCPFSWAVQGELWQHPGPGQQTAWDSLK